MTGRRALYAGSFDPPTAGHLWLVRAGAALFDEVIVAVGQNPEKPNQGLFAPEERVELWREVLAEAEIPHEAVQVILFGGCFTVDLARDHEASYLLRGIRGHQDIDHERIQRHINGDLAPDIQTVFLIPPRQLAEVSSTFVRGLIGLTGWRNAVEPMVPPAVLAALEKREPSR